MLLSTHIIPHHHHEGMFCTIMERCEDDGNINDEHTHHHENHEVPDDHSCLANAKYIAVRNNNEIKCAVSSCDNFTHDHISLVVYFFRDLFSSDTEFSKIKPEYGEYISYYKSAEASRIHGLRAPPSIG